MQRVISGLASLFPQRYRKFLFGSPVKPSWLGNAVHSLLNNLPGEDFPVLPCKGVLEGYRMKIDWQRHRSFIYGTWEPEVVSAISSVVCEGNVAIDIGSHIGFYTLLLSKLVGQGGLVIAFEPLLENFKVLEENVHLNNCTKVKAINKAVMNHSADKMELIVPSEQSSSVNSSFFASLLFKDHGEPVIVDAISIDDFVSSSKLPVHFIKMDAEGAEELILQGALKTIERYHPTMLIELHHPEGYKEDHPVIALLTKLGYEIQWLDRFQLTSHILANWLRKDN